MKKAAAQGCTEITHDRLVKKLCSGRLLHVDETNISVRGVNGYVWVLTSMEEVAYFFTPTREGNTIQELLKKFLGRLGHRFLCSVRCDISSGSKNVSSISSGILNSAMSRSTLLTKG